MSGGSGKVTMISRGVEISIKGGGEEIVCAYLLVGFLFVVLSISYVF